MPLRRRKKQIRSFVHSVDSDVSWAAAHVFRRRKEQTNLFWLRNAKQRHTDERSVGFSTEEATLRPPFNQVRKDLLIRLVSRRSVHNISLALARSRRSRAADGVGGWEGGRHTIKAAASSNFTLASRGQSPSTDAALAATLAQRKITCEKFEISYNRFGLWAFTNIDKKDVAF